MNVVFLDIETGGIEPERPIIQVAAVAVDLAEGIEVETFERKLRFDVTRCTPEALLINHHDADVWKRDAVDPGLVVQDLKQFLERHADVELPSKSGGTYRVAMVGGHNVVTFDLPRLHSLFKERHTFFPVSWHALDTLHGAAWYFFEKDPRPVDLKLTTLAAWFGFDVTDAHDALADAWLSANVARRLLGHNSLEKKVVDIPDEL
jgi:DNA polymerase III alpha subunit (gram-positive type)